MAVFDAVVLVGLMLQNPTPVEQQPATPTSAEPRDPALDRIRARLAEPPPMTLPPPVSLFQRRPTDRPLFQVHIEGERPLLGPGDWLDDGTSVPTYVRPTYTLTHHEFMLSVTPELFRGASVHPCCIPVLSIYRAIAPVVRGQIKKGKEARARREVDDALSQLKNPGTEESKKK